MIYSLLQETGDESKAKLRAARLRGLFENSSDYKRHKPCTNVDILVDELEWPERLLRDI